MKGIIEKTLGWWLCIVFLLCSGSLGHTQSTEPTDSQPQKAKAFLDLYGFAQLDAGYDFKQVDPDWFDVVRPTKLPAFANEFGADGNTFFGVRQTRFGAKSEVPTSLGTLKTIFEFELFGTGNNAGQTTFRLRHAYGELGQFGGGQYWSVFTDPDAFPNTVEYWGPNGIPFFRNVQFRWMPIRGDSRVTLALERPGASADQGVYQDRIELAGIKPHFPAPDITGEARLGRKWGYVRGAGIVRRIEWVDTGTTPFDLSGGVWGWGVSGSSTLKVYKKDAIKLQVTYGRGIENYMNDAPEDIGPKPNPGNALTPVIGVPLPLVGIMAYYDHYWSDKFSSSFGYSREDIDNSASQTDNAFRTGQYASTNLLYNPVKDMMVGGEFVYGYRKNFRDGWSVPDYRIQFVFKYNFSFRLGGS